MVTMATVYLCDYFLRFIEFLKGSMGYFKKLKKRIKLYSKI